MRANPHYIQAKVQKKQKQWMNDVNNKIIKTLATPQSLPGRNLAPSVDLSRSMHQPHRRSRQHITQLHGNKSCYQLNTDIPSVKTGQQFYKHAII